MTILSRGLRLSIIVATLVVIGLALATPDASPSASSWLVAAGAVSCAAGAAAIPDGHMSTAAIGLLLLHWLLVVDGEPHVMTPIAAIGVVVVHSAASIESITPVGSKLAQATYRLWATRALVIVGATIALWLVAVGADRVEHDGGLVVVALFGLLAGVGIWALRLRALGGDSGG